MAGFNVPWTEILNIFKLPTLISCSFLDNVEMIVNEMFLERTIGVKAMETGSLIRFKSVSPHVVSRQLKVVSPQPKGVSPQRKVVSPQLKVVSPQLLSRLVYSNLQWFYKSLEE